MFYAALVSLNGARGRSLVIQRLRLKVFQSGAFLTSPSYPVSVLRHPLRSQIGAQND